MNTNPKNITCTRDFQQGWLKEIASTLEILIANPAHKYHQILSKILIQDLNVIRNRVYAENAEAFKHIENPLLACLLVYPQSYNLNPEPPAALYVC